MRFATIALIVLWPAIPAAAQEQIRLEPIRDTTLYSESGELSNGAGDHLFAGRTASSAIRRALLAFDVSAIPSTATVMDATLTLHMSKTATGAETVSVHRVVADWGEAGSDAALQEGRGIAAETGDATWSHAVYPTIAWTTAGGDFVADASAQTSVGGIDSYSWSSELLIADVQDWVSGAAFNHGWILLGASGSQTAKRFDSREHPTAGFRPVLDVTFSTGTDVEQESVPVGASLAQNYPNPFGGRTEIQFSLTAPSEVTLEVFDLLGQRIQVLRQGRLQAGTHAETFDASSRPVGIYLARLRIGDRVMTRQMVHIPR